MWQNVGYINKLSDSKFEKPLSIIGLPILSWNVLYYSVSYLRLELFLYYNKLGMDSHLFLKKLINLFFSFIFISWRLITSRHCSGFCHTLTWISHGVTRIPPGFTILCQIEPESLMYAYTFNISRRYHLLPNWAHILYYMVPSADKRHCILCLEASPYGFVTIPPICKLWK